MSGILELYNQRKELVQARRYNYPNEIEKRIESWKHLYGKKFLELTVVDIPDFNSRKEKYKAKKGIPTHRIELHRFTKHTLKWGGATP